MLRGQVFNAAAFVFALGMIASWGCYGPEAAQEKLEVHLATLADGTPNPKAPAAILNDHGNRLDNRGEHEDALVFYDAALENHDPADFESLSEVWYNKGLAYRRLERYEASVKAYETSAELEPERPLEINISISLAELDRVDEAVEWLDRGIEKEGRTIPLLETKAMVLIDAQRHEQALPLARECLALRSANAGRDDQRYIQHWQGYIQSRDPRVLE